MTTPTTATTMPCAAADNLHMRRHPLDAQYEFLSLQIPASHPHVLVVSLDRSDKLNALHASLWRELGDCFGRQLGRLGDETRCVVLRGHGRAFCAGIDIELLSMPPFMHNNHNDTSKDSLDPARMGLAFSAKLRDMQAALTAVETCPVPVVAVLHGLCLGAGIDLACCASIRVCAPDTTFAVKEVQVGLAADVGTLQRLPHLVASSSWVYDVCLSGRDFGAVEAERYGLVSRIFVEHKGGTNTNNGNYPNHDILLQQALHEICDPIANNSPIAVVGTKHALLYSRDHSVPDGLEQMIAWNALALQTHDLPMAMKRHRQKQRQSAASFSNLAPQARL